MNDDDNVSARTSPIDDWTRALSRSVGAPGGGAATGVMLAIAASLASMVAGYTETTADSATELTALRRRTEALRVTALQLADADAVASRRFGAAFAREPGPDRDAAIRDASLDAARSSAALGTQAVAAVDDLEWLKQHSATALVADLAVALSAVRGALTGARANLSFDLGSLTGVGQSLDDVRASYPGLWTAVHDFDRAVARVDRIGEEIDDRAAPTD